MIKKLTRTGNSVALVLDKPLLDQLGLDENAEVELSTNGQVLVVTPTRDPARERKFRKSLDKINQKYAGVFRRLSES
jgi:antitoxin component of MazEF toxin-antitoxin module